MLKAGIISLLNKLASVLAAFLCSVVIARSVGPEEFGKYTLCISVILMMTIVAQAGIPKFLTRETASNLFNKNWALLSGDMRLGGILAGFAGVLISGIAAAAITLLFSSDVQYNIFLYGIPLIIINSIGAVRAGVVRGLGKIGSGLFPEMVLRPVLTLLIMLLFVISVDIVSAEHAVIANVLASSISLVIGLVVLNLLLPSDAKAAVPTYQVRRFKRALPILVMVFLDEANRQIGVIVLGLTATSFDVGIYKVAMQFSNLLLFGIAALDASSSPYFSRIRESGELNVLQRAAKFNSRVIWIVTAPAILMIVTLGPAFVTLIFGSEYQGAYAPLCILIIGPAALVVAGSASTLLVMTGLEQDAARNLLLGSILHVSLVLVLIPLWGNAGAAAASSAALTFQAYLMWRSCALKLKVEPSIFPARMERKDAA
ncbi:oligosaccharide flippase family protein [Pelagibacterium sp. H642]|uniref:oligosaccharide flippase family protein n=1 Tax=Pelagibacterium sp. H642 TaxID=1881069 RepID=UPI0028151C9C|nr:oligosaccharide flippase family protein [Pelagibacterium sp. H642]WMT89354.1 oligosaccharide flippase family protein [Pelagibacterium sp. H642]